MNYLALGDSYTIGEQVDYNLNFPNQVVDILLKQRIDLKLEKLIAVTGWTTDELAKAIYEQQPSFDNDWVTLLIGVNNQYRGKSSEEYAWQFYSLLCQSILFAKGNPKRVIVLSIPDWGLTPFNKDRDKKITSAQIDELNIINKKITTELNCHYIDITPSTREHADDLSYLVSDLLHYSEKEYKIWAEKIATIIKNNLV
jgi:lysophospholipase L1-like esterase